MSSQPRPIELLAPAKDLSTALEAILHGADAIYIGAPRFGARSAVGVSIEDIQTLCREAHRFGVRVYVALNTILYDDEVEEARLLAWDLYRAGADALIIQDMGLTLLSLPPIPLHASTQCDTCTPEDALLLEALGFEQIVLARELNTEQIRRICSAVSRPIEVFVHGALCVSYSGRCYLSQALTKRSANRGACSQQCRLPYNLLDARGQYIQTDTHLLSLRDLNRADELEKLLEVGVTSLKIEGRLKGMSYVKNITAYYRRRLDELILRYPDRYRRASYGDVHHSFTPDPAKSFNRGFTTYSFYPKDPHRPQASVINPRSPKSQGQYIGTLTAARGRTWSLRTQAKLTAGDGLLYVTPTGEVGGVNINAASTNGEVSLARPVNIPRGSKIYRNFDQSFERQLAVQSASRTLPIRLALEATEEGFTLHATSIERPTISVSMPMPWVHQLAKRFDPERIKSELGKLGGTIFSAVWIELDFGGQELFLPLSMLSELRRDTISSLESLWTSSITPLRSERTERMPLLDRSTLPRKAEGWHADYRANISNSYARRHYEAMGYSTPSKAFELEETRDAELMCTKHCIRHELGYCPREHHRELPFVEPLYLEHDGQQRLRLEFDCARCQMKIYRS